MVNVLRWNAASGDEACEARKRLRAAGPGCALEDAVTGSPPKRTRYDAGPGYRLLLSGALRASPNHRAALAAQGLNYFTIYAAPAVGPRSFVTMAFDLQLAELVGSGALTGTKWLLGASTAALRFSALLATVCSTNKGRAAGQHGCSSHARGQAAQLGPSTACMRGADGPVETAPYGGCGRPQHAGGPVPGVDAGGISSSSSTTSSRDAADDSEDCGAADAVSADGCCAASAHQRQDGAGGLRSQQCVEAAVVIDGAHRKAASTVRIAVLVTAGDASAEAAALPDALLHGEKSHAFQLAAGDDMHGGNGGNSNGASEAGDADRDDRGAAAGACGEPASGGASLSLTEQLRDHFLAMTYRHGDSPQVLTPMMTELYDKVAPAALLPYMVSHPQLRLAVMVASLHPPYAKLPDALLKATFAAFMAANAASPAALRLLLTRMCFYTGPDPPPFAADPWVRCVPLTADNYHDVLRATTCVPFVSERCTHINGVGHGLFYDGALTDYYINVRADGPSHSVLLLGDQPAVKRTIFDAALPWRTADDAFLEHCTVVQPNEAFVRQLPAARFPDTWDWFNKEYVACPALRQQHWRAAYDMSLACWPGDLSALLPESTTSPLAPAAGARGAGRAGTAAGEAVDEPQQAARVAGAALVGVQAL